VDVAIIAAILVHKSGNSHSVTKRKRWHKSGHRKDTTGAAMSKLKQLELKQPKKPAQKQLTPGLSGQSQNHDQ
jgi:hypothetical protein